MTICICFNDISEHPARALRSAMQRLRTAGNTVIAYVPRAATLGGMMSTRHYFNTNQIKISEVYSRRPKADLFVTPEDIKTVKK